MGERSLREIMQDNPWFQALEPHLFEKLLEIASLVSWEEGEIIFREGDPGSHLYLILEGQIAVDFYVPGRGRVTIHTLVDSDLFGWSAVLPVVGTRTASVRSMRPTRAIAFDSAALRRACEEDHDLGYHVFRRLTNVVAARLSATRLQLLDVYAHETG